MKFAQREARRGNRYDGIILDPPAYGHGPDGEKWKLDECLFGMLRTVGELLAPQDAFLVLNLYSNGTPPSWARPWSGRPCTPSRWRAVSWRSAISSTKPCRCPSWYG